MTAASTAGHGRPVGADQHLDWRQAAASLLDWWTEAGVGALVDEAPRDWLVPPPAPAPAAAPLPAATPAGAWPADWTAYAAWRHGPDAPEQGWAGGWVAAAGPVGAPLMVLSDCPDRDDPEGGLLAGEPGRLFDRMLAAIGLTRGEVHLASVCAKRPTAGRIPPADEERLAALAHHHLALARPRALLLLGNAASRAILATDVASARGRLHALNHRGGETGKGTGVVASFHPRFLLEKPAAKAGAWADLRALKRLLGE